MLEARNARRRRRGEDELDIDQELSRLIAPAVDDELRGEIRDMVVARSHRRAGQGKPPWTSRPRSSVRSSLSATWPQALIRQASAGDRLPGPWPTHAELGWTIWSIVRLCFSTPRPKSSSSSTTHPELDSEIFNMEEFEADWVHISDESFPWTSIAATSCSRPSRSTCTRARPRRRTTAETPPTSSRKTIRRPGGSSAVRRSRGRPAGRPPVAASGLSLVVLAAVEDRRALLHLQHVLSGGLGCRRCTSGSWLWRQWSPSRSIHGGSPEPSAPPPTEPSIPASAERSLVVNWL